MYGVILGGAVVTGVGLSTGNPILIGAGVGIIAGGMRASSDPKANILTGAIKGAAIGAASGYIGGACASYLGGGILADTFVLGAGTYLSGGIGKMTAAAVGEDKDWGFNLGASIGGGIIGGTMIKNYFSGGTGSSNGDDLGSSRGSVIGKKELPSFMK